LANSAVTVYYHAGQPYNIQYNLIVQRQLASNTAISVAYVGSRGVHLWQQLEGNPTIPTAVVNDVQYWSNSVPLCQIGTIPTCRINPNFGSVNTNNTVGVSNYNSLQVVVNKRLSSGLEAQAAYTYGHSLDTPMGQLVAADCAGAPGMDTGVSSNTRANDYGPSCFDVRQNFRMSLLYYFRISTRTACSRSLSTAGGPATSSLSRRAFRLRRFWLPTGLIPATSASG
jgi:hypothetical protein